LLDAATFRAALTMSNRKNSGAPRGDRGRQRSTRSGQDPKTIGQQADAAALRGLAVEHPQRGH
jgi:hypothetical protein